MVHWLVTALLVGAIPPGKSVVVLPLQGGQGLSPGFSAAATAVLVDRVRDARVFESVTSITGMETVLGVEQQRQMMDCTDRGCAAELGAALGTDYVLSGSASKVGSTFVVSLSLTDARTAAAAGSASQAISSEDEAAILAELNALVARALEKSVDMPAAAAPSPHSMGAPPVPPAADEPAHPGLARPLLVGAGIVALGAALPLLLAAMGVTAAATTLALRNQDVILGTGLGRWLLPTLVAGSAASVVGVVTLVGMLVAATGLGVAGGIQWLL